MSINHFMKRHQIAYFTSKGIKLHTKNVKRKKREQKRRAGYKWFVQMLRQKSEKENIPFNPPRYRQDRYFARLGKKPSYGVTIEFLLKKIDSFSPKPVPDYENGYLYIPNIFSLSENYTESMYFLKRLFYLLHKQRVDDIIIDYENCNRLDLDASICMDLIIACFISYFKRCSVKGHHVRCNSILPVNVRKLDKKNKRFLFSIGAYRNIRGLNIRDKDVIAFDLRIGDNKHSNDGRVKEVHETEIVDYVLECLHKMNRSLTPEAETNLSKVVGEVMANSEEHSKFRYRYAIGYFEDNTDEHNSHVGTFNLVIFNFGQTIYESFKESTEVNSKLINQMEELSANFTKKGFFKRAEFTEETLWTLYALQEGVTSKKDWRRGNGSIRFIDSFFKLKGDGLKDNISNLMLISGNTRIIFDGVYPLKTVVKGADARSYQMMTFNESGDIHEKPDKKYVNFTPAFFPGTLISAKIYITYNNVEVLNDGNSE